MLTSLAEFKFFQSFRMPVEEADQVRFLVEIENDIDQYDYVDDAKLIDVSTSGVAFSTSARLSVGEPLRISLQYKKIVLDLEGNVVRAFSAGIDDEVITYGVQLDEDSNLRKFLERFIFSLGPERLRDCLFQLSLSDRYSRPSEGIEMFSLLIAVFKDITKFGNNDDFIRSLLEEVTRVLNSQRASLFLINPETNQLESVCALGMSGDEKLKFDYRQGIAGSVFTTGVPLNIDVLHDETRFTEKIDLETGFKTKSIICNPILNLEEKVIGVIEALNKKNENRFSVEDEKVMKVLSLVFSSIYHDFNPVSENTQIRRFSTPFDREYAIIGRTSSINSLRKAIVKLKDLDSPVLIQGEPGVGKSLFATVIHMESKRGLKRLEIIDCSIPFEKLNKKIFGEDQLLNEIQGGTVVFKNIDSLNNAQQTQLLELINNGAYSNSDITFDFRSIVISANDLEHAVSEGKLREDLFEYFSKGFIEIPPLRERSDDIELLINYFLKVECRKQGLLLKAFSPKLLEEFTEYDWDGNVAELKRYVDRSVALNPRNHIISEINDLSIPKLKKSIRGLKVFDDIPHAADFSLNLKDRVSLIERKLIENEIKRHNNNKSKAAKSMGISREALRKKLIQSDEILVRLSEEETKEKKAA